MNYANGDSMCLGGGNSYGSNHGSNPECNGTKPPSTWFTFPGDPCWRI